MEETKEQVHGLSNEEVQDYLNNNGLLTKWEVSGLFEQVSNNSEKYLIASIMETMIYRSFEMIEKEGKSKEEMLAFQEKYMGFMANLGVFNGKLMTEAVK